MCKQCWDERRHVAISLRQMNKGYSVCVLYVCVCDDEGQEAGLSQI